MHSVDFDLINYFVNLFFKNFILKYLMDVICCNKRVFQIEQSNKKRSNCFSEFTFGFRNIFISSALDVPLVDFFKHVSQFLPNSRFKSIQALDPGRKTPFLKRTHWHFHSCFLVFSYHVNIIEKQYFECILLNHLFAFSNVV